MEGQNVADLLQAAGTFHHEYIVGQLYSKGVINLETYGLVVMSKTRREAKQSLVQSIASEWNFTSLRSLVEVLFQSARDHSIPSHHLLANEIGCILHSSSSSHAVAGSEKTSYGFSNPALTSLEQSNERTQAQSEIRFGCWAFRKVFIDFELLSSSILTPPVLHCLLSAKILSYDIYKEVCDVSQKIVDRRNNLLYYIALQNTDTLLLLASKLKEVAVKEKLIPLHNLGNKLQAAINSDGSLTLPTCTEPAPACRTSTYINPDKLTCQSSALSTKSQPKYPAARDLSVQQYSGQGAESEFEVVCEHPDIIQSLDVLFGNDLKPIARVCGPILRKHSETECGNIVVSSNLSAMASLTPDPSTIQRVKVTGFLKSKTSSDLILFLLRLGGTDHERVHLAYQTLKCRKDVCVEFHILNTLGAVNASPRTAHLFKEALKLTDRIECKNSLILQCRLNYLLHICYITTDKDLAEHYMTTAYQLSTQISPDFTTALINISMARNLLAKCEETRAPVQSSTIKEMAHFSNVSSEMCSKMPNWMQPFSVVLDILKMQQDARWARLMHVTGNEAGAMATAMSVGNFVSSFERSEVFSTLIPRQMATVLYTKTILSVLLDDDLEQARKHASAAHTLYLKVGSCEAARRVMEIVDTT